jgi:hypothetical protein
LENKAAFLSGKLTGTKTLESELEAIKNPDEIEMFLRAFIKTKFTLDTDNEVIYVNDDEDFNMRISDLEKCETVSIYVNESFTRLYITTLNKITYAVRINKVSTNLINSFISKETPVKYTLNSFSFVRWCNSKSIDLRNVYDIPTYIKLLTNDIDPFKTVEEYIKEYSDEELSEEDNEKNCVLIGNFIYKFGTYLAEFVEKFSLSSVNRLINENSYFEAISHEESGLCKIRFSYIDLTKHIKEVIEDKIKEYEERAYLISPLGRIAIKFGRKSENIMFELYADDIQLMILNELYNNNIKVTLLEENLYQVTCKYKSFSSIITMVTAILNDIFYTMFQDTVDIKLDCIVKE